MAGGRAPAVAAGFVIGQNARRTSLCRLSIRARNRKRASCISSSSIATSGAPESCHAIGRRLKRSFRFPCTLDGHIPGTGEAVGFHNLFSRGRIHEVANHTWNASLLLFQNSGCRLVARSCSPLSGSRSTGARPRRVPFLPAPTNTAGRSEPAHTSWAPRIARPPTGVRPVRPQPCT